MIVHPHMPFLVAAGLACSLVLPPPLFTATASADPSIGSEMTNVASAAPPSGALLTGLVCYVGGLAALTAWEELVVPTLKLRSILPDVPLVDGQLTVRQKEAPWITPLTADGAVPTLDALRAGDVRVGRREGVAQYLALDAATALPRVPKVQEPSAAWSEVYGVPVTIYKKQRWTA